MKLNIIFVGFIHDIGYYSISCKTLLLIFMHIKHMAKLIKITVRKLYTEPLMTVLDIFNSLMNIVVKLFIKLA